MLAAMRRGRSPGLPGGSSGGSSNASAAGGSNAAAAGSSGGGAAAAGSNAAAVRPEKAIVFSQWTSMLDLLEVPLKKAGFVFRRLDGTMSVAQREKAIADFETCPEVRRALISREGGNCQWHVFSVLLTQELHWDMHHHSTVTRCVQMCLSCARR
jgi:SNF2 family DNA or RNA helicase